MKNNGGETADPLRSSYPLKSASMANIHQEKKQVTVKKDMKSKVHLNVYIYI